jgi:hypothetical protein
LLQSKLGPIRPAAVVSFVIGGGAWLGGNDRPPASLLLDIPAGGVDMLSRLGVFGTCDADAIGSFLASSAKPARN